MNGYGAVPEYDETDSRAAREKQERKFSYSTGISVTDNSVSDIGTSELTFNGSNMGTPSWMSSSIDRAKTISNEYLGVWSDPGAQRDEDYVKDVVKSSQTATTGGRKFDGDKLEYGLVPPIGFKAVVEILTIGAQKYDRDNWKHVPDGKRRYFDAAMRHLWDWKSGDKYDEETSKNHLAHAICNLMFLLEKDLLTE